MRPFTFRGTFEHALDAKHRLTIPAKYRAALANGVVISFAPEADGNPDKGCLSLWETEAFDARAEAALAAINPLSPRARLLRRALYNNSWEAELDSANRLMIPAPAMALAGITKEVVIAGSGECLEVWDRVRYAPSNEAVLTEFPELIKSLDHTD